MDPSLLSLGIVLVLFTAKTGAVSCTVDGDCSSNEYCNSGTCACTFLYGGSVGSCTQKQCTTPNAANDCGANTKCSGASPNLCLCNDGFVEDGGSCRKSCATASLAADCGSATTSYCSATTGGKCYCVANYQETADNDGVDCTQITCSGTATTNCVANSACTSDNCECASGYETDGASCRKSCATVSLAADCGSATTSYCSAATGGKCYCVANYEDATDNDGKSCTQIECTSSNVGTVCGSNSYCTSEGKCSCNINYEATSGTCTLKDCTTPATNCGANTKCLDVSGTDKCSCDTNYVVDGASCRKSCATATLAADCGSATTSYCSATTNGMCKCVANYEDTTNNDGVGCTQIACSGTDTTNCVANSVCTNNLCVCKSGTEGASCNFASTTVFNGILHLVGLLLAFAISRTIG